MRKPRGPPEIQNPLPGPFSFLDITWEETTRKGWGNATAIVHAFIPYNRVQDFINGQCCEDGSSVGWNVKKRKKGKAKIKPYFSSFIEHVWYECAYGPEDHRNDPQFPRSLKRGCVAGFSVKHLEIYPDVAEVAYYHVDHTREDGTPAHGPSDPDSLGRRTAHQPRMTAQIKMWVQRKLTAGFTSLQIFEEHRRNWNERMKLNVPNTRDDFIKLKDIAYLEGCQKRGI
jgi:hypothetical protein